MYVEIYHFYIGSRYRESYARCVGGVFEGVSSHFSPWEIHKASVNVLKHVSLPEKASENQGAVQYNINREYAKKQDESFHNQK